MPYKKGSRININLDKVERKKLAQFRELMPEYEDLELSQVAHLALKDYLFNKVVSLKNNKAFYEISSRNPAYMC